MNYGRKNTAKQRSQLQARSTKKRKKTGLRILKVFLLLFFGISIITLIVGGLLFKKIIDETPQITADSIKPSAFTTTVYANDGTTVLGTFVGSGSNRVYTSLEDIPKDLQNAFIAVEDSRFWEHNGIDVKGITRAALKGLTSGNFSQGGSTITQQLIKNSVFPNFNLESSWEKVERKIQELYLAVQIEKIVDKNEILENYLNTINLGQNTLGVQSASTRYFGKDVSELTLSECAVIAGITKSPTGYNPITKPEANASRREKVLSDMLEQEYITQEQYDEALADTEDVYQRIQTANTAHKDNITVNSYFLDEVAKQVLSDLQTEVGYSEEDAYEALYSGGLKIITTQDLTMQQICDEELNDASNYPSKIEWTVNGAISIAHPDGTQNHYDHSNFGAYIKNLYGEKYGPTGITFPSESTANTMLEQYIETLKTSADDTVYTNITISPQPQATIVIIDQYTGYVKAMVGGRGEKTANMTLNRATQSAQQPGSTFKVLSTFVPALDLNDNTLATTILDAPLKYTTGEKKSVSNWWGGYRGDLTIRYCIEESANVCTVRKYQELRKEISNFGVQYLTDTFGFTTLDSTHDTGEAISLGGIYNGVYNIELTAAYASIANGGTYTEPILYTQIYDNQGNLLYKNAPKTHTAMKDSTAYLITSAMQDVVTKGTGTAARLTGWTCAGKTGTTSDTRDLWFSGYTPYLTASVWSGYDDNQEIEGSSSYHKVIWRKVMQRIHDTMEYESKNFEVPESVSRKKLCTETGLLANDACTTYSEYFAEGTGPSKKCTKHVKELEEDSEDAEDTDDSKKDKDKEKDSSDNKSSDDKKKNP